MFGQYLFMADLNENYGMNGESSGTTVNTAINENIEKGSQEKGENKRDEITLKFGKGLVGDEFTGKDGNNYRQISIPNADPEDKSPWKTFVLRSNQVHESKFSNGMWCKLPADGHTTVRQGVVTGHDEQGNAIWENKTEKISNKELKAMVESYKTRNKEQTQDQSQEQSQDQSHEQFHEHTSGQTQDSSQLQEKAESVERAETQPKEPTKIPMKERIAQKKEAAMEQNKQSAIAKVATKTTAQEEAI